MKKIIISLTIFSLFFPILSANALMKKRKHTPPCPDTVKEGIEIAQHCVGVTVVCPAIAVEGSQVSARCAGASGITTLCPLYSDNPPAGCTHISQRPDEQYVEQPNPISPGSTDGMSGSTDRVAQPDYPDPTLNLIGPIDPLPDDGRVGGKGGGMGLGAEYCSINKGAKSCTSCSNSNSYSPQYPENTGNHAKEKKEQCTTCSITTVRLVPRVGCDSNADCILVRGDCCDGCSQIAINKSQKSKYSSLLNNACNPPLKEGELGGKGSCGCGYSHGRPIYKAVCRETNWKIPSSLTTCQEVLEQSSVGGATVGGATVGGGTTDSSVQ